MLCSTILDAISTIFHSDPANYFILEPQNTLNQFAEKIHLKLTEVQEKFFRLVEFVVFQLNYVPCKELISLSLVLKNHASVQCSIHCMHLLLTVLRYFFARQLMNLDYIAAFSIRLNLKWCSYATLNDLLIIHFNL